ncbi:MAG: ribosome recycling factor [bacterium]|jgi:ribosome recycling factor
MIDLILEETEEKMKKSLAAFRRELATIRTGKATTTLLDGIKVDAYGQSMPLNQVASISVPEPRLILVQPWDQTIVSDVEKAIQKSNTGLVPNTDKNVIRLPIPPLTEERRVELVKVVKKHAEESRVSVRNIRRDANEHLKKAQKDGDISEDDSHKAVDKVQKLTDKYVEEIDKVLADKEKEIMEV